MFPKFHNFSIFRHSRWFNGLDDRQAPTPPEVTQNVKLLYKFSVNDGTSDSFIA